MRPARPFVCLSVPYSRRAPDSKITRRKSRKIRLSYYYRFRSFRFVIIVILTYDFLNWKLAHPFRYRWRFTPVPKLSRWKRSKSPVRQFERSQGLADRWRWQNRRTNRQTNGRTDGRRFFDYNRTDWLARLLVRWPAGVTRSIVPEHGDISGQALVDGMRCGGYMQTGRRMKSSK